VAISHTPHIELQERPVFIGFVALYPQDCTDKGGRGGGGGGVMSVSKCSFSLFGGCGKNFRDFFIAFLNSPCHEQNNRGRKKTEEKKATCVVVVMDPDVFFKIFCGVFLSPGYETQKKTR
jgi:hypothetical protein